MSNHDHLRPVTVTLFQLSWVIDVYDIIISISMFYKLLVSNGVICYSFVLWVT